MKISTLTEIEDSQKIINSTTFDFINFIGCTIKNISTHLIYIIFKIAVKFFTLVVNLIFYLIGPEKIYTFCYYMIKLISYYFRTSLERYKIF